MNTRSLPPLTAVRVFDAAARHGTFTSAADELGMTQSAVSYQIKVLEERVGAPLFERYARGVGLTAIGQRFHQRTAAALDILSDAYGDAKGAVEGALSISVIPTFATNFLAQHLGAFQLEQPGIAVRMEISEALTDFTQDDIDVAIRGGQGKWEGLVSHLLMPTTFTPMLSPELIDSIGGIHSPEDLLKLPILSKDDPWWRIWLATAGVADTSAETHAARSFGPQVVEAGAAMSGHGVAMLTPAFFQNELARGQLIQPFEEIGDDGSGYWLVYPESRRNALKIRRFRSWIEKATRAYRQA
ncbi:LysR substrate-binding domain-containing protein [uncultured Roseobacter sp.]|uniref:LysR substrate-binding domain-containing protein n=1 Tax=uncultured Roseobacter sp. TaxID=114847 RepID=UPI0026088A6B|nr:LysR substrate-binding domain-containing protein [uncultured Roseobacter sp.]